MVFGFKKYKGAFSPSMYLCEHFVLRFANKLSSIGTQALAIIDMELWKSSCDDMHWRQGKYYIYCWQFEHVSSNIC